MFGKYILDNRKNTTLLYDGDSVGCGIISFHCTKCDNLIREETFTLSIDFKQELYDLFNIKKIPHNHFSTAGLLSCDSCNAKYALCVSYGEVTMCHYQSAILVIVEYEE